MIKNSDLGKIKRFYFVNGDVFLGVITGVSDMCRGPIAEAILEDGSMRNIFADSLTKVTFTKNINPYTREMLEALGKTVVEESKKQLKLEKELAEVSNNLRESRILEDKKKADTRDILATFYAKENNLITSEEADKVLSNAKAYLSFNVMTKDDFNCHRIQMDSFERFNGKLTVSIPMMSIKYAKPGDFNGMIYLEYDNTTHCDYDENAAESIIDSHLKKLSYNFKDIKNKAKKLSNKNFDLSLRGDLAVGDKTSTLYLDVLVKTKKNFKLDRANVEELNKALISLFKWF